MQTETFDIAGPVLITPRRFGDARGYFVEAYSERAMRPIVGTPFVQDNEAYSERAGTVRGLHFQKPPAAQGKLVRAVAGAALDVAVDLRHGSTSFGRHLAVRLDAESGKTFWVPPGFAHGYCTLDPRTLVAYKVTHPYSPTDEMGLLWDDPALGIAWPMLSEGPHLSDRDRSLPLLAELPALFALEPETTA